jgi:citrate lyase beta subunit
MPARIRYPRKVLAAFAEAEPRGSGAVTLGEGEMIDLVDVRRAHDSIALAESIGVA